MKTQVACEAVQARLRQRPSLLVQREARPAVAHETCTSSFTSLKTVQRKRLSDKQRLKQELGSPPSPQAEWCKCSECQLKCRVPERPGTWATWRRALLRPQLCSVSQVSMATAAEGQGGKRPGRPAPLFQRFHADPFLDAPGGGGGAGLTPPPPHTHTCPAVFHIHVNFYLKIRKNKNP